MRDPIKILYHRATKVPAIQDFLDNILEHSLEDIEDLDIKRSDKKLLRTHFKRFGKHKKEEIVSAYAHQIAEKMPRNENDPVIYEVLVYEGDDTTYDGFEVKPGTIITQDKDWIRFDFYRIKKKEDPSEILSRCRAVGSMNISETNFYIKNSVNNRNGVSTSTTKHWAESIRIG